MDNLYWLSEGQCHVFDPFAPRAMDVHALMTGLSS